MSLNTKTTNPELSRLLTDQLSKQGYEINPDFRGINNPLIGGPITSLEHDALQIPQIFNDYFEPGETLPDWDELPPTFTVCECLEMLPPVTIDGCTFTASLDKMSSLAKSQHYWAMYNGGDLSSFASSNPADAVGNLLLSVLLSNIAINCDKITEI